MLNCLRVFFALSSVRSFFRLLFLSFALSCTLSFVNTIYFNNLFRLLFFSALSVLYSFIYHSTLCSFFRSLRFLFYLLFLSLFYSLIHMFALSFTLLLFLSLFYSLIHMFALSFTFLLFLSLVYSLIHMFALSFTILLFLLLFHVFVCYAQCCNHLGVFRCFCVKFVLFTCEIGYVYLLVFVFW